MVTSEMVDVGKEIGCRTSKRRIQSAALSDSPFTLRHAGSRDAERVSNAAPDARDRFARKVNSRTAQG